MITLGGMLEYLGVGCLSCSGIMGQTPTYMVLSSLKRLLTTQLCVVAATGYFEIPVRIYSEDVNLDFGTYQKFTN